jgi:hypothetical protein
MTTPDPTGDALKATATAPCCDQMLGDLFIDGRYVEATCPVHGRQPEFAVALNASRTPPPVSLHEVAEGLTECIAALENSDPRWPSIERRARALLTRLKEHHALPQS